MSAGPSTSACTRGPAAIASTLVSPAAFSICASMPIRPTGRPCVVSSWRQQQVERVNVGSVGHLGQHDDVEVRAGASTTTSMTSAWVHGVVQSLTRTPRN